LPVVTAKKPAAWGNIDVIEAISFGHNTCRPIRCDSQKITLRRRIVVTGADGQENLAGPGYPGLMGVPNCRLVLWKSDMESK
jgi:hypothetical protein